MSHHRTPHTSTTPLRAVRITGTTLEEISIDRTRTVTALQQGIGCRNFDVLSLPGDIDFYVDDEGAINGSPLNLPLTIIAPVVDVIVANVDTTRFHGVKSVTLYVQFDQPRSEEVRSRSNRTPSRAM